MSSNQLFVGASEYYARYRILYPNIVTDLIVKKSNIEVCGTILDLGCGTGQLSIPFALSGYTVHAVDMDSSMLFQGIVLAEQHECRSIRWQIGSDKTLRELKLPALDLCVMGASFHWMDRSVLIKTLDEFIIPQGRIVVVSGSPASVWGDSPSGWEEIVKSTIQKYLGAIRRAGSGSYSHPPKRHQDVLQESPFCVMEEYNVPYTIRMSVNDIIGLQLSTSYASPEVLGELKDQFVNELSNALDHSSTNGYFDVETTYEIIIASRSSSY